MTPKRRGHKIADLRRQAPRKEPYDRVLIVCEGEKTETNYFRELCDIQKLSTANIVVMQGEGNDPVSVVKTAKSRQDRERKQGEKYDRVYCVFDRDEHANYREGCQKAEKENFVCALSNPCFEYWLLLHFRDSRAPYARSGGRTAAQNCEYDLKKEFPAYRKGHQGLFKELLPRLPVAKKRAASILKDARRTKEDNPSTRVHELVEYLERLKD
jgi:hypothetical protein